MTDLEARILMISVDSKDSPKVIEAQARKALKEREKQTRKDQLDKWGY